MPRKTRAKKAKAKFPLNYLIIGIIAIIVIVGVALVALNLSPSEIIGPATGGTPPSSTKCSDGTSVGQCSSVSLGKSCSQAGTISWDCKTCGCSSTDFCDTDPASATFNQCVTKTFDQTPPMLSSPNIVRGSTSVTVTFSTDEPARTQIDYGESAFFGYTLKNNSLVVSHTFTVTGLTSSTTYYYRITAWDAANNIVRSSPESFMTIR